ncbi:MAG: ABC transporter ATP-binding protein, partial [Candidatus Saccharibacteria bacterium]|nr:ABC transporter ATP-binding protein [Candidatus Saccharibacteria bacterium]
LTERALNGLLAHSQNFFANSKTGALAGDVNTFSRSYASIADVVALQASSILVNFVTSLVIIAWLAPMTLPALLLLTIFICFDVFRSYRNRSEYRNERKEQQSRLFGNFADILGNQTLVRMFGRSKDEVSEIVNQRKSIQNIVEKEVEILQRGAEVRMTGLFLFQTFTLLLCLFLFSNSMLSIAALIFIITYLGRVTGTLFAINGILRGLEQAFLDASKITEILDDTPEILDRDDAKKLQVRRADIELNGISFAYRDTDNQTVFHDLNLSIRNKESIGLVGKSGGGKSTLTQLLLRYMDINSGQIIIDGQNIADVTQASLRDVIAYVPQDPFLFHRSLRDNIAYGKKGANDNEIIEAARKAHALEFIEKLPKGLDTIVGERGVKLSGGQRQRIAIARAILKDAPILILDEATSSLDSESERLIQKALEKLMKNRTSIVIAHRLSTIAKLDRIVVLDNGKIIEEGSHGELLEKSGTYAKLWSHQSGGFLED